MGQDIKSFNAKMTRLTSSLGKFVARMGVIALAGVAAFSVFAKSGIEAASDLQEVQNVVDTAFGEMSDKCEEFADSALESFGLSEYSAKKMASTYMAMGKSMGLSMEQASDMAINASKRTADIASFYNLTAEEAAVKLKSIYTGETETLKDLGIVMTEANLKQYALSQGITKSYSAMTQAEKVALRYAFVMNASADAAGDFARTQNSWANQTKILSENFREFKTVIGSYLITALTPVVQTLNTIISQITMIAKSAKELLSSIFGIEFQEAAASASGTASGIADIESGYEDAAAATKKASKAQKDYNKSLASFDRLNILSSGKDSSKKTDESGVTDQSMVNKLLASSQADDSAIKKTEDSIDNLKNKFSKLFKSIAPVTNAVKKLNNEGLAKLKEFNSKNLQLFYEKFLKPVGKFMLSKKGLPRLFNITNDLLKKIKWKKLNKVTAEFYETLDKFARLTWTALMDFYENFLEPIAVWTLNEAVPKLVECLSKLVKKFEKSDSINNLKQLWKILSKFTTKIGDGLINFVTGMAELGLDFLLSINWQTFNEGLESLLNIIANVATNVGEGIINFFDGVQPIATWLTNELITFLSAFLNAIDGFISENPETIQAVTGALLGLFVALMSIKITRSISTNISNMKNAVVGLVKSAMAHPIATAAGLIATLAGAIVTMVAANKKSESQIWFSGFTASLDNLKQKVDDVNTSIDTINSNLDDASAEANGDYQYLKDLADKYYELSNKVNKSNTEIEQMKQLAQMMEKAIGKDSPYGIAIDETTGLITTQKNELYNNIQAMREQALEAAKTEALKDYYKELVTAEVNVAEAKQKVKEAAEEYNKAEKKAIEKTRGYGTEMDKVAIATAKQKTALTEAKEVLDAARESYKKVNNKISAIQSTLDAFNPTSASDELDTAATNMDTSVSNASTNITTYMGNVANDIASAGETGVDKFKGYMDKMVDSADEKGQEAGKKIKTGIEESISAINYSTDPRFSVVVGKKTKTAMKALGGIFTNGVWKNIPQYASGMPSGIRGSLFWAGEAGPEIVAQGRSGSSEILNASQIASAIYSAVVAANKTGGGRAVVQIVPDTGNLYKAIVKQNDKNILITNKNPFNK